MQNKRIVKIKGISQRHCKRVMMLPSASNDSTPPSAQGVYYEAPAVDRPFADIECEKILKALGQFCFDEWKLDTQAAQAIIDYTNATSTSVFEKQIECASHFNFTQKPKYIDRFPDYDQANITATGLSSIMALSGFFESLLDHGNKTELMFLIDKMFQLGSCTLSKMETGVVKTTKP